MTINARDFWQAETALIRLKKYWREVSSIEGRIDRAYFSSGHGKSLLKELSDEDRQNAISILIELNVPAIHLEKLNGITRKLETWKNEKGKKCNGFYDPTKRVIFVNPDTDSFRRTFFHELGHFFDFEFLKKIHLDRSNDLETLATLYTKLHAGNTEEREAVKIFLGI